MVYNTILGHARKGYHSPKKAVVLVKGGPGTGKSLIAVNVMATLAKESFVVQHATGSRAFTENLRREVGRRAASQFKYFNSFVHAEDNALDVVICDEAHRIRESSNDRFTPKSDRSDRYQINEIVDAAKVAVFLIHDHQVVRPGEIGSWISSGTQQKAPTPLWWRKNFIRSLGVLAPKLSFHGSITYSESGKRVMSALKPQMLLTSAYLRVLRSLPRRSRLG